MDEKDKKDINNSKPPDIEQKSDDTHTVSSKNSNGTDEKQNSEKTDTPLDFKSTQNERTKKFETEFTQLFSGLVSASKEKKNQIASDAPLIQPSVLEKAMSAFTNMHLAHEISIDADYRIEVPEKKNDMESRIAEIMRKVFWDKVDEDLSKSPPDYNPALSVFIEIRDNLLTLLMPHNSSMKSTIQEFLDVDQIKKEVAYDALDFPKYVNFVVDCLSQLCSPHRDEQVKAIRQYHKPSEIFRCLFEVMDLMHLDMANFYLSMYRPQIMQNCASYERQKFVEFLELQYQMSQDGMKTTKEWLLRHKIEGRDSAATIAKAFGEILVTWNKENPWPETLILDDKRFAKISLVIKRAIVLSSMSFSIIERCKPIFPTKYAILNTIRAELDKSSRILLPLEHVNDEAKFTDDIEACAEEAVRVVGQQFKTLEGKELPQESAKCLKEAIRDVLNPDNKVRSLLTMRILQYVEENILSEFKHKVVLNPGLSSIQDEIESSTTEFCKIVTHNRNAYNKIYVDIIENKIPETNFNSGVPDLLFTEYLNTLKGNQPPGEKATEHVAESSQISSEENQVDPTFKYPPPSGVVQERNTSATMKSDISGQSHENLVTIKPPMSALSQKNLKHPRTPSNTTLTENDSDSSSYDSVEALLEKKSKTTANELTVNANSGPKSENHLPPSTTDKNTMAFITDNNNGSEVKILWSQKTVDVAPSQSEHCLSNPLTQKLSKPIDVMYPSSQLVNCSDDGSLEYFSSSVPVLLQGDNSSDDYSPPIGETPNLCNTYLPENFTYDNPMLTEMVVNYEAHKASCDLQDHICNTQASKKDTEGRLDVDVEVINCKNNWSARKEEIYQKWRHPSEGRLRSDQVIDDEVLENILKVKNIVKGEESGISAGKTIIDCVSIDKKKEDECQNKGLENKMKSPAGEENEDT